MSRRRSAIKEVNDWYLSVRSSSTSPSVSGELEFRDPNLEGLEAAVETEAVSSLTENLTLKFEAPLDSRL